MKKVFSMIGAGAITALVAMALVPSGITFGQAPTTAGTVTRAASSQTTPKKIEVNQYGVVNIRGTVSAVTADSLTVQSWGGAWTIRITPNAVVKNFQQHSIVDPVADFQVGDYVGAHGVMREASMIIDADLVRNHVNRPERDNDNDRKPDVLDKDDDNDGIVDTADTKPFDHDNDGKNDADDADDDNDGIVDTSDTKVFDHDNDGMKDENDADDDNDGIGDKNDAKPMDHDNDGTDDAADTDDDNDGVADATDTKPFDHDNDGMRDDRDTDDDNDRILDVIDQRPFERDAATTSPNSLGSITPGTATDALR